MRFFASQIPAVKWKMTVIGMLCSSWLISLLIGQHMGSLVYAHLQV